MSDRKSRNFEANIPSYFPEENGINICRYCDNQDLQSLAREKCIELFGEHYTDDQYEDIYEKMYKNTNVCYACYEEECSDEMY